MWKILLRLQKKSIFSISAGIFLAVFLGCCIGWMEQFENISQYLEYRFNTGSYIAYFSGDLTREDIAVIAEDENVSQCGIVTYYKKIAEGKGKDVWLRGADENYMLRNSVVTKGALPQKRNEFIAEEWIVKALGLEPEAGESILFRLEDEEGNCSTEEFILSGVLSNSAYTKETGTMNIFIPLDLDKDSSPIVNLDIRQEADLAESLEKIAAKINSQNVFYKFSSDAGRMREELNGLTAGKALKGILAAGILLAYLYGIYRLGEEQFQKDIAKLRMCGFGVRTIMNGFAGVMAGIFAGSAALGILCAQAAAELLEKAAGLDQVSYLFWGENVGIKPEIFLPEIILMLVFFAAASAGLWGMMYKTAAGGTVLSQLRQGEGGERKSCRMGEKGRIYFKTEWISIGMTVVAGVMFLTVNYSQLCEKRMMENEIFAQCRNGDFQIAGFVGEDISNGVSQEQLKKIIDMPGTLQADTAMVLPVRVVLGDQAAPAQDYYKKYNEIAKDMYFKEYIGKEPLSGETVYKSSLMGYNDSALQKLVPYVTEGTIDIEKMASSNTAVLFVPQYVEGKYRQRFYQNAQMVMDYKVGDKITVKVRDDYEKEMEAYWAMEDHVPDHEEVFEIGAIVYYPYLLNTSVMGLVNPDVIISGKRMEELTGQDVYRVVSLEMKKGYEEEKYEEGLQEIFSAAGGVTIDNYISSRQEKQMRMQIYAIVTGLWSILAGGGLAICALNGFRQHIRQRKGDLALCRMVGFSRRELRMWARKEGWAYFIKVFIPTVSIAYLFQYWIYKKSGNLVMGLPFWGNELWKVLFAGIAFLMTRVLFEKMTDHMISGGMIGEYREE